MPRLPHLPTAPNTPVMNRVSSQMRLMMRLSFRRWAVVKAALVILAMPATVAAQTAESIEYFHTDAIGSVRMVTGPTGEVLERRDFLPFGEELAPPPNAQPLGFAGAERDAETANSSWMASNYMGARIMQAAIGRFLSVDPGHADGTLTDPQSWNGYAYARNNPLFFVDPDGRQSCVPDDCNFAQAVRAAERAGDQAESEAGLQASSKAYWDSFFNSQSKRIILAPPPMSGTCEQYGTCLKIDWDEVGFTLATTVVFEGRLASLVGNGVVAFRAWRAARGGAAVAKRGTTVLGHFPAYINKSKELGTRPFNVPTHIWNKMSDAERWAANRKFLDRMIARGDNIVLATPAGQARPGSFFAKELEYLASKGFVPSADGLSMLPR